MKLHSFAAGAVVALGLTVAAGAANATTYLLTVDTCTGNCIIAPATNAGSVKVTDIVGGLHFDILLADNVYFNQAGQGHETLGMQFTLVGADTFQNFVETDVVGGHPTGDFGPISFVETGNGNFDGLKYGLDWAGTANNGHLTTTGIKEVKFDVIGANTTVAAFAANPNLYFKVDVASIFPTGAVRTGIVEATLSPGVPEPETWALMILGFGGAGAMLRRSRRTAAVA